MVCIEASKRKMLCEENDISEHLRRTVIETVHLKSHRFDEDHCQKIEKYLLTEVHITLQEETLGVKQDEFSLTELENA